MYHICVNMEKARGKPPHKEPYMMWKWQTGQVDPLCKGKTTIISMQNATIYTENLTVSDDFNDKAWINLYKTICGGS